MIWDSLNDPARAWMNEAACAGSPPELFLPGSPDPARAMDICTACPVIDRCRSWADSNDERFGIWAGQWVSRTDPPA